MYTYLVFGLTDMTALACLMTKEKATETITLFYKDQLPQFLHGIDYSGMEWALRTDKIQVLSTKPYVADPNAQATPPGTAPVWKPNFNSGRN